MNKALLSFDLYPKVVPIKEAVVVVIEVLDEKYAFKDMEYFVKVVAVSERINEEFNGDTTVEAKVISSTKLSFKFSFPKEEEYFIRVYTRDMLMRGNRGLFQMSLYALKEDLYKRIPLKGDFHSHSTGSDGRESPEIVASRYREKGFDFFALTDHGAYEPSEKAYNAFRELNLDFNIVKGEEVHSYDNNVHIVNFGGKKSVHQQFRTKEGTDSFLKEVREIESSLKNLSEEVDTFIYASCQWIATEIRKVEGLAIFCHPFWEPNSRNVPVEQSISMLNSGMFDAFEILGGQPVHTNNKQVALYYDAKIRGKNEIPIVGNSDSHGTIDIHWFDYTKTIVFASKNRTEDIIEAVKGNYSVAVETPLNEQIRAYGSYRLVNYAHFLMNHWFPIHDALCVEEGRLMKEVYLSREGARERIEMCKVDLNALIEKYFR